MNKLDDVLTQRPLIQITTWRSGSTPIHHLLSSYLLQTRGIESLGGFFDVWENGYQERNGSIVRRPPRRRLPGPFDFSTQPKETPVRISNRVKMYQKHLGEYFVLTHPLQPQVMNWIFETHTPVFTYRKDLPGQMISFLISCALGAWYLPAGLFPEKGTLTAHLEWFLELEADINRYFQLQQLCSEAPRISFEEFNSADPRALLNKIGLRESWESSLVEMPKRQNSDSFSEKLMAFRNASEIEIWYKDSILQSRSPWPMTK